MQKKKIPQSSVERMAGNRLCVDRPCGCEEGREMEGLEENASVCCIRVLGKKYVGVYIYICIYMS